MRSGQLRGPRGWAKSKLQSPDDERRDTAWRKDSERLALVWGTAACAVCGRIILLGEETGLLRSGERAVEVCTACEGRVPSGGLQRAA